MNSSQIDLLEKKVFDKLNKTEQMEFDQLMSQDTNYAANYQLTTEAFAYASNENLFKLRAKLSDIHAQETSRLKNKVVDIRKMIHYAASIAAIVMIFLGSYYLINQHTSTDVLYHQYYHIDDVYLNTRSGDAMPSDNLEKALALFENKQYEKSLKIFESLPGSITATYYSGVANMEMGDYDVAIYKFDQVIKNYLNVFYDQATWYKGLCLLKKGKSKDAKDIFSAISKSDSFYKNQAQVLLKEMK